MLNLVVRDDFAQYKKGDIISDPAKVEELKDNPHVIKVINAGDQQ